MDIVAIHGSFQILPLISFLPFSMAFVFPDEDLFDLGLLLYIVAKILSFARLLVSFFRVRSFW